MYANDEGWLSQKYYVSYMIMQINMTMKMYVIKMERWKFHGNISRNGYGNAIIGRYCGCFEEDIRRLHYCRMPLTRHYDQRPFDETVCDAIIANGGVKTRQKRCKTFAM